VLAGIAAVAYIWAARRERPSGRRITLFVVGLLIVAASLNSPLETIASKRLLLIHLLQNALIADVAPPLILLGLTPHMRARLNELGLHKLRARYALPAWLVAWYGTHIAGFYDWALRTGWALNIEHAVLILGGLLFWWPLISGRL
jgi:cytochrome c oxidase assembly factor CtaG